MLEVRNVTIIAVLNGYYALISECRRRGLVALVREGVVWLHVDYKLFSKLTSQNRHSVQILQV